MPSASSFATVAITPAPTRDTRRRRWRVRSRCKLGGEEALRRPLIVQAASGDPVESLHRRHIRQVNVLALTASALAILPFFSAPG